MAHNNSKQQIYVGIFAGVLFYAVFYFLAAGITFAQQRYIVSQTSSENLVNAFNSYPFVILNAVLALLLSVVPLVAGFITGKIVKVDGVKYGVILGICVKAIFLTFIVGVFIARQNSFVAGTSLYEQVGDRFLVHTVGQIIKMLDPTLVVLTAVGAYFGQKVKR